MFFVLLCFFICEIMLSGRPRTTILFVFLLSILYACTRYVILGPVSATQIPLFIINKAISLSGLVFIVLSFVGKGDSLHKKLLGETGFLFTLSHIVISILLINETYFEKFFKAGEYNLTGGLSLLFGVMAFAMLLVISRSFAADLYPFLTQRNRYLLKTSILLLIALHVAIMGWEVWIAPHNWYGYFPPITLISFLIAFTGIIKVTIRYYQRKV